MESPQDKQGPNSWGLLLLPVGRAGSETPVSGLLPTQPQRVSLGARASLSRQELEFAHRPSRPSPLPPGGSHQNRPRVKARSLRKAIQLEKRPSSSPPGALLSKPLPAASRAGAGRSLAPPLARTT